MKLPVIDARSQPAKIGIETTPGKYEIHSSQAILDIRSRAAVVDIHQQAPELYVDATRFWEAFNGGSAFSLVQRIASQIPGLVRQNIEHIVEKGNRMAALNNGGPNPIPDIAYEDSHSGGTNLEYLGAASSDNIDITFTVHKPEINIQPGGVDIQAYPQKPSIEYHRGSVKTYMQQYPSVTIIPPAVDVRI